MNRFAAHGLVDAASRGRTIIVVTRVRDDDVLDHLLAQCEEREIGRVRRVNGQHSLHFVSGGAIAIRSYRQGLRATAADTVYLDEGVDVEAPLSLHEDARRVVSTSPVGEVVRA